MTGYRLPFLGIMPFFLGQVVRGVGYLPIELNIKVLQFGVNIRALDEVVLKAEYHYILYDDPEAIFGFDTLQQFYTQIAWAF